MKNGSLLRYSTSNKNYHKGVSMNKSFFFLVASVLFFIFIIVGSFFIPVSKLSVLSLNDKMLHGIAYFFFALFFYALLSAWNISHVKNFFITIVLLNSVGFIIECIQHFVKHRSFDLYDLYANFIGVLAGTVFYMIIKFIFFH